MSASEGVGSHFNLCSPVCDIVTAGRLISEAAVEDDFEISADRRGRLPFAIAATMLIGGISGIILDSPSPILWTAAMVAVLLFDALKLTPIEADEKPSSSLPIAWAIFVATIYAILPAMLLLHGGAAQAAIALALCVAGLSYPAQLWSRQPGQALASAAPIATCFFIAPLATAALTSEADFFAAVCALAIWGALSIAALNWWRGREQAGIALEDALADMTAKPDLLCEAFDCAPVKTAALDRKLRLVAANKAWLAAAPTHASGEILRGDGLIGRRLYDMAPDLPEAWRERMQRAAQGETISFVHEPYPAGAGLQCLSGKMVPRRDRKGILRGIVVYIREALSFQGVDDGRRLKKLSARLRAIPTYTTRIA